eukprot:11587470-Alexandrium_andersonii.AAC.1
MLALSANNGAECQPRLKALQQKGSSASCSFSAPARGAVAPRTPRCSPGGLRPPRTPPQKAPPAQSAGIAFLGVSGG